MSESERQHSPTPWRLSDFESEFILGADLRPVCQMFSKSEEDFPNAKPNAEFIVRACNSHDAMLQALKEALPYMRSRGLPGGVYNPTLQQMVKAIAQAEGKE